jgi:hypothetical protein
MYVSALLVELALAQKIDQIMQMLLKVELLPLIVAAQHV